ncbi:hypothetical protein [Bacillus piscicola]|uniref:hypothetical protein n=1 Tax=Bacillus piscicola TaxID=1632684 RepID=UPI001F08FAD9|nr:hypothetical protein [Bacillus piscicola]
MGRWLSLLIVGMTIMIGSFGWWHWQKQSEQVNAELTNVSSAAPSTEKVAQDTENTAEVLEKQRPPTPERKEHKEQTTEVPPASELAAPFANQFVRINEKYKSELEDYLQQARKEYQEHLPEKKQVHKDIVDKYRGKADQLENQLDELFETQMEALKESLRKEGYDESYTWEYEWEYENVKETKRIAFIRELIALRSFT